MNPKLLQKSVWYQGVNLNERITSIKEVSNQKLLFKINVELAKQKMHRWRSQSSFMTDEHFSQRLALNEITEEEFLYLLIEPIEAVEKRFLEPPTWLVNLAQALSEPNVYKNKNLLPQEEFKGKESRLFLSVIEPLIDQSSKHLLEKIRILNQNQADLPFDPKTVIKVLSANLPRKLLMMLSRTIALEIQVARLQGRLQGDTPQQRFYNFFEQLQQSEQAIALLEEYPVLTRQLTICITQWATFSWEFLNHLCADWEAIKVTLNQKEDIGQLVAVNGGMGDSHRDGRSVLIASFSSGFQIVYKPRSLAIDIHFQQLLTWLNERGEHPPFRTLTIINRDSYGWVEFVTPQSCTTKEEIQHFYERQGAYLALLYALEATDFHHENLIAAGEHPILVDLESLFHPRVGNVNLFSSELLAWEILNNSVLRIGLLPQRIWSKDNSEGIDISGLGANEGQLIPGNFICFEGLGTDNFHVERKQMMMPAKYHRPTLNGTEVNVLDYTEFLNAGFTKIYQVLLKYRDELLSQNSPLTYFAKDEVRVILRPTRFYNLLLRESFHPDLLRDALKRDQFFDRLWFNIELQSHLARVIRAEYEDLWRNDIPMFVTYPNSPDLFTCSGEKIPNFFDESGMTLVKSRLEKLSNSDLAQQIDFINASLNSLATVSEHTYSLNYTLSEPQNKIDREQLLRTAQAAGDRLSELAIRGKEDATWIGLMQTNGGYSLASLGIDLYDGIPGITLFLAYLGAITQEKRYTFLAEAALKTLKNQIERSKSSFKSIGSFSGWGGLIYTLMHLSQLWNQSDLLKKAEELVKLLPLLVEQDRALDISGGTAGCLISLLNLYRYAPSETTLAVALQCGDRLLAKAQSMAKGIAWKTPIPVTQPLTGFAHGAAGIAWALLELSALTGEERFQKAAVEAIAYERSLFIPEMGNWPDLRNFTNKVLSERDRNQHYCMTAWCYGAPGIGLARLGSLPYLDNAEVRAEINTALKTTLNNGFGNNHSLCHGDLGNLELLCCASQILDEPHWKTEVDRLAAIILESIYQYGWLCGVPLKVETPGLMSGIAGIGYGLLRLAEPELVPSVLLLKPPTLKQ